ncbi:uncharacterized protein L969DRAFT_71922 [Mixia osmundae IAM 14324]|uniref:Uncharacterized protein n=1 Tax=Mixia osmundae (strain CBS 9802 / IAM 14324 / JCM 22182 / KY 12970) TaxID=764103 RepID=G7E5X2_MIXOS|nr:uncharacterized protein L969DRAFT_71922 [Mixia osmundae IAM 14324]KEI40616.1 hypothetical protein L969DRAFT_71922 [Mixia osmundae IAM 14324]GAA98232.1 hypothetical protein E5Q_04915 [Mixia osmundae IAM 14324]
MIRTIRDCRSSSRRRTSIGRGDDEDDEEGAGGLRAAISKSKQSVEPALKEKDKKKKGRKVAAAEDEESYGPENLIVQEFEPTKSRGKESKGSTNACFSRILRVSSLQMACRAHLLLSRCPHREQDDL